MTALPKHKYSLKEYFEIERNSEEKLEYWDGNIWSMAGASPQHERIVVNIGGHLRELFRGRGCSVFGSNLKAKVPDYPPYRYPDLSVYYGEGVYETMDGLEVLTNPQMLVEVLSPSTETFDRGDKFSYYKSIPSFTEYLLVAANRPFITHLLNKTKLNGLNAKLTGWTANCFYQPLMLKFYFRKFI
ncbi:hypothetical protein BH24ACI2_BH24ACI2_00080 [soil metagenome]|jgi:Uma2 family endonuclease|nr:Uma2 family endonuclease [Acidobacteriota bacterium]